MTLIVGNPYTAPPPATDPNFAQVTFLSNTDAQPVTDVKGKAMETTGSVKVVNDVKLFTEGSLYCDGTLAYVSVAASAALAFGAGDFTVQMRYRPGAKVKAYPRILNFAPNSTNLSWTNTNAWAIMDRHNSAPKKISVAFYKVGGHAILLQSASDVVDLEWMWIALMRRGPTITLFIDGKPEAAYNIGTSAIDEGTVNALSIGGIYFSGIDDACIKGHVEDIRATKLALFTGEYEPETVAFPRQ